MSRALSAAHGLMSGAAPGVFAPASAAVRRADADCCGGAPVATDAPAVEHPGPTAAAVALRAALPAAAEALTPGERHVLGEWLDRLAADK